MVLACVALTYDGVSLFVVAFAVDPPGAGLFRDADIPKRLLPASIALGACTFTRHAAGPEHDGQILRMSR